MKAQEFRPGARVALNEASGNPGRMAFVLYPSNVSDELIVRFDGFAYNSRVPAANFEVLPDVAFRQYDHMTGHDICPGCRPELS